MCVCVSVFCILWRNAEVRKRQFLVGLKWCVSKKRDAKRRTQAIQICGSNNETTTCTHARLYIAIVATNTCEEFTKIFTDFLFNIIFFSRLCVRGNEGEGAKTWMRKAYNWNPCRGIVCLHVFSVWKTGPLPFASSLSRHFLTKWIFHCVLNHTNQKWEKRQTFHLIRTIHRNRMESKIPGRKAYDEKAAKHKIKHMGTEIILMVRKCTIKLHAISSLMQWERTLTLVYLCLLLSLKTFHTFFSVFLSFLLENMVWKWIAICSLSKYIRFVTLSSGVAACREGKHTVTAKAFHIIISDNTLKENACSICCSLVFCAICFSDYCFLFVQLK